MKVIFLDVDGVLNSEDDLMVYREKNNITGCILYDAVEDRPLKLLKQLVDKSGAKIVLSSSWRYGHAKLIDKDIFGGRLYQKITERLKNYEMEIYDVTPRLHESDKHRGDEIRDWMKNSKETIESFVILDDDSDMCEFTETNLIKTTYKSGLTQEHVDKALEILKIKKDITQYTIF
ncbi:MAG: HAD domain-containing protein [Lachnospiraceae bacterium]|nr:HAD domain-containing protein [Lachnospiraceae bacterium]